MNDIAQEGNWQWTNGEIVDFTNWFTGNPNNASGWNPGGDEDAVVLVYDGTYWNDGNDWTGKWNDDADINDGRFEHQLRGIAENCICAPPCT